MGAEEAEVEEGLKRNGIAGGVDAAKDVDGFGTSVDASLGATAGVAERSAEDGNLNGSLGWSSRAEAGAANGF